MARPVQRRIPGFAWELLCFTALTPALWWIYANGGHQADLRGVLNDRRKDLYTVVIGLEAGLLGVIVATLTIALGYAQAPRFEIIRETAQWSRLFGTYTRSIRWAACGTLTGLAALLFDRDRSPHLSLTASCSITLIFTAIFIARMLWVTEGVVRIITAPGTRRPGQ